ncbi:sigma factor-like helix-turn-helix DNA-binding protein [Nocardioides sp. NPDC047086]|uniref:sigma factor-like helix-turn-helix DNA-binding protein n=1 Tax=Nocardioides sp. NPDC047086 TaxID=3154810 RepID=UPI0033CD700B
MLYFPAMGDARKESVEIRWLRRLAAAGWESWVDAAAWAHANDVGVTAIAARLDVPIQTVSKRLKAAGVHVRRPAVLSEKAERMVAELRELQSEDSQRNARSRELGQWLARVRGERKRGKHRAVMDLLDEIAPGWDTVPPTRQPGRTASEEERWNKAYAAAGWTSLADGLVWAEEHNVSWTGVADYLGFEKKAVRKRATEEGIRNPRPLSEREVRVLEFARRRAEADDPWSELAHDEIAELSSFLAYHRKKAADGSHSRVHDLLEEVDPEWTIPFDLRRGTCGLDSCEEPARRSGLCTAHEIKLRYDVKRPKRSPGAMTIPCLECGRRLERLTNHIKGEHGMSKADYVTVHPGAPLVSAVAMTPVWRADREAGLSIAERLDAIFDTLDDRSWAVLEDHFLSETPIPFEEIGQRFGVTGPRMLQIEQTARQAVADAIDTEPVLRRVTVTIASQAQRVHPVSELTLETPGLGSTAVSVGKPALWVLAQFSDAYDVTDGWCALPTVSAAIARTTASLIELTDAYGAACLSSTGLDAIGHGSRPEWLEEWLDYCGYWVRGDLVWPKNRKVSDEIAMTLANAARPLTIRDLHDRLITSPSLTTVRNRLSNDPRFHPVQRGVWMLTADHIDGQS